MKKLDLDFISSKQGKELFAFVIFSIVIIIFDFSFVLKIQWVKLLALKPQLVESRQKIKEFLGDEYRTETFKRRLSELTSAVGTKKSGIVDEEAIPSLMNEISKIADSVNLKIMQIKPQKEISDPTKFTVEKTKEYYILPIAIVAQGPYHSLGKFLDKLEKFATFIKLNNLDMVSQADVALGLDVKLSIYIFVVKKI